MSSVLGDLNEDDFESLLRADPAVTARLLLGPEGPQQGIDLWERYARSLAHFIAAYREGLVHEEDFGVLSAALETGRVVLELYQAESFGRLPSAARKRLFTNLVQPLQELLPLAEGQGVDPVRAVALGDVASIQAWLRAPMRYRTRSLDAEANARVGHCLEDYRVGDIAALPRAEGGFGRGIVMGPGDAHSLRVIELHGPDALAHESLTGEDLELTPFRPGDYLPSTPMLTSSSKKARRVVTGRREIWVHGPVDDFVPGRTYQNGEAVHPGDFVALARDTALGPRYFIHLDELWEVAKALDGGGGKRPEKRRVRPVREVPPVDSGMSLDPAEPAMSDAPSAQEAASSIPGEPIVEEQTVPGHVLTHELLQATQWADPEGDSLVIDHGSEPEPSILSADEDRAVHIYKLVPDYFASILATGGQELRGIWGFEAEAGRGALFSHRGIGYKDYNEDAALVGVLPGTEGRPATLYAGAFDQAGGMGSLAKEVGLASRIAAEAFEQAVKDVSERRAPPEVALRAAVDRATDELTRVNAEHGIRMATTFAAVVVQERVAHAVNVGDSEVMLFSAEGELRASTLPHNFGEQLFRSTGEPDAGLSYSNIVTRAVGEERGSSADYYQWGLEAGDWLVLVSDGVTDAHLIAQLEATDQGVGWREHHSVVTRRKLSQLVAGASSPEEVIARLRDFALAQMCNGEGKPDNISIVVLQLSPQ